MDTGAIIMFVIGATLLWGGLAVAVVTYQRASRRETD